MAKRYVYFVSYLKKESFYFGEKECISEGVYNEEVSCNSVVSSIEQIRQMEKDIKERNSYTLSITIINYKPLREEEIEED